MSLHHSFTYFLTLAHQRLHANKKSWAYESALLLYPFLLIHVHKRYTCRRKESNHTGGARAQTSAVFSLLNMDNPLLSPCISRPSCLTQPTASSHNLPLSQEGFSLCLRTESWLGWRLNTLYLNVSIWANPLKSSTELQITRTLREKDKNEN